MCLMAFWFGEEGFSASSTWAGSITISGRVKKKDIEDPGEGKES